jgi:hypothetical protein
MQLALRFSFASSAPTRLQARCKQRANSLATLFAGCLHGVCRLFGRDEAKAEFGTQSALKGVRNPWPNHPSVEIVH